MSNRDKNLIKLLKLANELGFTIVGVQDNYPDGSDIIEATDVSKKYGVFYSNGSMPIDLYIERMKATDHYTNQRVIKELKNIRKNMGVGYFEDKEF